MNYSTLLNRSVDFDLYRLVLDASYPDSSTQQICFALMQMLWDRAETNGYAQHLTRRSVPAARPATGPAAGGVRRPSGERVRAQVEARTMGAAATSPRSAPGREFGGEHGFGIQPIRRYPWRRSAYFLFDTGAVLSPLENLPPREGHDPHDDTPKIPAAQALKDTFWRNRGFVNDECGSGPCTGPQF